MEWFRLYHDIINDPKVMLLPVETRWYYIAVLCLASSNKKRGKLPNNFDSAFALRLTLDEWENVSKQLSDKGFLKKRGGRWVVNGWNKRQYDSDNSTLMWKRWKEKPILNQNCSNIGSNIGPIASDTDTDTDTEQKKEQPEQKQKKPPLLDQELGMWTAGCKITQETLPLTDEWRRTLLEIRVDRNGGIDNFLKACRNLMRKQDFPQRSIVYFVGKQREAISRVVYWAAMPVKGKSPPETGKMTAAQQKALDEAPKVDHEVVKKMVADAKKNIAEAAKKMTVKYD